LEEGTNEERGAAHGKYSGDENWKKMSGRLNLNHRPPAAELCQVLVHLATAIPSNFKGLLLDVPEVWQRATRLAHPAIGGN
jgi:hypothetical protein